MKKNWIAVLALMLVLTALCAACGGGDSDEPAVEAAVEATELPIVTAPPAGGEEEVVGMLTADDNSAPERRNRTEWLESLSPEHRLVEEELIGATVEELYKAIGQPKEATYTTSCVVANGEDGLLYYDGFYVATTRFPTGVEYVMGTDVS